MTATMPKQPTAMAKLLAPLANHRAFSFDRKLGLTGAPSIAPLLVLVNRQTVFGHHGQAPRASSPHRASRSASPKLVESPPIATKSSSSVSPTTEHPSLWLTETCSSDLHWTDSSESHQRALFSSVRAFVGLPQAFSLYFC